MTSENSDPSAPRSPRAPRSDRGENRRKSSDSRSEDRHSSRRGSGGGGRRSGSSFKDGKARPPRAEEEPAKVAAPKKTMEPAEWDQLLGTVSRSFSLSIRILPEALREPISVAYLLARATDTLADTADAPLDLRREAIRDLVEMLKYGPDMEALRKWQKPIGSHQTHEGEKALIKKLPELLGWYESLSDRDREEILWVLLRISHGQELDLVRFGAAKEGIVALKTADELHEYTYLVAGCVGEFWTRLCARHCDPFATRPTTELLKLGREFGQALQLINILRDIPTDLADGRCYLPESELSAAGLTLEEGSGNLLNNQALTTIRDTWMVQARQKLDTAWDYTLAMHPRSLRFACALPVILGARTLNLLEKPNSILNPVKVPRSETKRLIVLLSAACWARPLLNALYKKRG